MDVDDTETKTLDGSLIFKETRKSTCEGCAVSASYGRGLPVVAPPCSRGVRKDGRNGIWIHR